MRTIAVIGRKGGSGKTTVAVHLAIGLHLRGRTTLLADTDPQHSSLEVLRGRKDPGPTAIASAAGKLFALQVDLTRTGADALIIDTPAVLEEEVAQAVVLADVALLIVRPTFLDLSGVGRILFVEDEDAVRGVAARLLRARGYEVIEARDGEEALELAELHAGEIDLLISDVIMPGLDGPTMLKKARKFLGDAPVMFISGYAEAEFSDLLEGETGVTFLPKPLDIKILAEKVKQQLAGG